MAERALILILVAGLWLNTPHCRLQLVDTTLKFLKIRIIHTAFFPFYILSLFYFILIEEQGYWVKQKTLEHKVETYP